VRLWIAVAGFFLVRDVLRIEQARNTHAVVTVWMGVQLILWVAVLAFWSYAAWRGWKRRAASTLGT